VTDENLRQFLGYKILRNKKTVTKRGAAKKRSDAPPYPRPAAKKRASEPADATPEDVPLKKKKQTIPLAALGTKRTPLRRPVPKTNTEEGLAIFRGFVPEVSQTRGAGHLPPFGLRDETSFKASHHGSDVPHEDPNAGASMATSLASTRSEGEAEPTPESSLVPAMCRVKHVARRKKFGPRDRLVEIISGAE
jgi:hypothetical protein